MKPWLKLGSVAATLVFLAACSSGVQQADLEQGDETPELTTQAETVVWRRIAAFSDDVEETQSTGSITRSSTDLDFTDVNAVGLRFTGIDVPKGATVLEANLFFLPSASSSGAATMRIYAQTSDNAATFEGSPYEVTNRPRATSISWSVPTWTVGMTLQNAAVKSPNLASIVQTVVNRSGWQSGNALALMVGTDGLREAHAFDGEPGNKPSLEITYTTDAPPPPSTSCLKNINRVIANPTSGVQYDVMDYGLNVEIDARGENFTVKNEASNGRKPMQVLNNGLDLCISGGKYDTLDGDNATWDAYHYGAAISVNDSPNVVMDNLTVYVGGDAIAFKGGGHGVDNWVVRDSYIRHAGDDAAENDAKFNGLVDDVLVDWAYQGISCRTGGSAGTVKDPPGTVTLQDSLIALKRQNGTYDPASPAGHLYIFKWEKDSGVAPCKLRLRNTVFYMQQNNKVFDSLADPANLVV